MTAEFHCMFFISYILHFSTAAVNHILRFFICHCFLIFIFGQFQILCFASCFQRIRFRVGESVPSRRVSELATLETTNTLQIHY